MYYSAHLIPFPSLPYPNPLRLKRTILPSSVGVYVPLLLLEPGEEGDCMKEGCTYFVYSDIFLLLKTGPLLYLYFYGLSKINGT